MILPGAHCSFIVSGMRIAIISPYSRGPLRGNITTVRRIGRFLQRFGMELLILPTDAFSATEMKQRLTDFDADLIHAFHAGYCGALAHRLAEQFHLPYLITITGSDLHDPLLREQTDTASSLHAAQAVVCFDDSEAGMLAGYFPPVADRVTVIPQGVEPLAVAAETDFGLPDDTFVLLLPAALRPVKQIEFPLKELAPLTGRYPALRLIIAGGVIDQNYAVTIRHMLGAVSNARWLGEVPREHMGSLYARADVVLNCSYFESMPNTLLEAMAMGRPVLATDIPGNRSLVRHDDTGLLYRDSISFAAAVVRLMEDAALREALGRRAAEMIRSSFSPEQEATAYIRLYQEMAAAWHNDTSVNRHTEGKQKE